jgi:hypothetical protein
MVIADGNRCVELEREFFFTAGSETALRHRETRDRLQLLIAIIVLSGSEATPA